LQRHDRDVELPAVEERQPRPEIVCAEVDLARFSCKLEGGTAEPRRMFSSSQKLDERLRPQMLVEVDRRHALILASESQVRESSDKGGREADTTLTD